MATFTSDKGKLYIDNHEVLHGWESWNGFYWFATKFIQRQDSDMGNGQVIKNDTIWYGYVQGLEEEWGDFSQGEIEALGPKVWEIAAFNLPFAGRRS